MTRFSVVIPTLDEENTLRRCVAQVRALDPHVEIIAVDGGSRDDTIRIAQDEHVVVCHSPRGRGIQCNTGAAVASGDALIFLHADSELPSNAFDLLGEAFKDPAVQIGTFSLAFDVKHWLLSSYCKLSKLNLWLAHFGDQCIVVRKSFLSSLGGFPHWLLFEDLALMRSARKQTRVRRFAATVTTSSRRFILNGILRQQALNVWYSLQYLLGVSPNRLAINYERQRNHRPETSLGIMVRFPVPGKVKTRLMADLGAELATEFYTVCAEQILAQSKLLSPKATRYIFCADILEIDKVRRWAGRGFYYIPQAEGDLGLRLEHAFGTLFSHGARKAIMVASDTPDLSSSIINNAVQALEKHDIVLGPAEDGGYYLIGMKKFNYRLFQGIKWSTGQVLRQTLDTANGLGLSSYLLPTLMDIDTAEDLRRWLKAPANDKRPWFKGQKEGIGREIAVLS